MFVAAMQSGIAVDKIILSEENENFDWTEELHKDESGDEHIQRLIRAILKQAILEDIHEVTFEQVEDGLKVVFKDMSFRWDKDKINLEEKIKKISPDTEIWIL